MIPRVVLAVLLVIAPGLALGQVINGGFSDGLDGWTFSFVNGDETTIAPYIRVGGPCTWFSGAVVAMFEASPAMACLSQEFSCTGGAQGQCSIEFEYAHEFLQATSRFVARIDGIEVFSTFEGVSTCTATGPFAISCGTHTIEFCLDLISIQEFGTAAPIVDNVRSSCDGVLPTEHSSWGRIKALFKLEM